MIDLLPVIKIAPIFLVALMSPGPDFMLVSSTAFSRGRLAGLQATLGIACGNMLYASLSVLGLGMVFAHWHWLSVAVRVAGGLYLIYLGILMWRESFKPAVANPSAAPLRRKNPFVAGLMTNLTNPKALAFFTSIFALALPPTVSAPTQTVLIATIAALSAMWFGLVTIALSTPALRNVYMRWSKNIDRLAGTCMGFFGARLLLSVRE